MRAVVLVALVLAGCGSPVATRPSATTTSSHARNDCSSQSGADFPGAFTNPHNLVHGPLVLTGAAYTDPATVREFGARC